MSDADQLYVQIHRQEAVNGRYRNFRRERQMDVLESRLAFDFEGARDLKVADVCCGQGRLLYYLSQFNSAQQYIGIEILDEVLDLAAEHLTGLRNVELRKGDLFSLGAQYGKAFDIVIIYKTLLNFENLPGALDNLFAAAKSKIYISSLFYEGDADFIIKMYKKAYFGENNYVHYNVYGMPGFEKACRQRGARDVLFHPLRLDIELPEPADKDSVSAHTKRLADGSLLELVGPIAMNWQLVEITL